MGWFIRFSAVFRARLTSCQVKNIETGAMAAAKIIPVKYEEELEDFVVEVCAAVAL